MPSCHNTVFAVIASVTLAACTPALVAPDSPVELPESWSEATNRTTEAIALESHWWQRFGSTELEELITSALAGNPDLSIATERVIQAEIAVRTAGASLFPTLSLDTSTSARVRDGSGVTPRSDEASSLALVASYEIDIWGSRYTGLQGSRAQLTATRHDYEAARLSLVSGVVSAYAQTLAQQARIDIARENLAIAERLFQIVETRYRHGAASALDVSRQRTAVLSQRDAILPLQTQARQTLRALALLLGRVPQEFDIDGGAFDLLAIPELEAPLPSELLARRPDLAAAEARLLAANADIAIARAALFPVRLSVGVNAGLSSTQFGLLSLGNPAGTATLTLSLLQSIFDGGRLQGQVASSESRKRQLVEEYRRSILTALKEVDDAQSAVTRSHTLEQSQHEIVAENERSLRLAELRYREGSDSLGTLLDTQRTLFAAQDQLVQQRLARLNATVDLYKALGGGWQAETAATRPVTTRQRTH